MEIEENEYTESTDRSNCLNVPAMTMQSERRSKNDEESKGGLVASKDSVE